MKVLHHETNKRRRQRGNTMVETALTLVMFFMLTFGIVGFGRAVWAFGWVSHAAREGSRWASVRGSKSGQVCSASDVSTYVSQQTAGLDASKLTVNTTWINNNQPGSYVQVDVQYVVTQIVPWVPEMTLESKSQFMIAQ